MKKVIGVYQIENDVILCNGFFKDVNKVLITTFNNAKLLWHPMDESLNVIMDGVCVCSFSHLELDEMTWQLDTNIEC